MIKQTFIVEKGDRGTSDFIIVPNGIKNIPVKVPVLVDFDQNMVVGEADIFRKDGIVYATADIPEEYMNFYPAIGVRTIRKENSEGIKKLIESEIFSIALCSQRNADESIKSISAQSKSAI